MKKYALAAAIASSVLASPGLAQDNRSFSGFKATALTGYDNADFGSFIVGNQRTDLRNAQGLIYGLNIGYDRQTGKFVYGVELEANDSASDVNDQFLGQIEMGRELYAGGRVGLAVSNKALIYGKVGYVNARLRTVGFQSIGLVGFRAGGGIDYKVKNNLFARIEYRYSEIDRGIKRNQVIAGLGLKF